jgi:chromatin remodeling complex protein RSC6
MQGDRCTAEIFASDSAKPLHRVITQGMSMDAGSRQEESSTCEQRAQQPVQSSAALAAIVGSAPIARSDVVSKLWDHIKNNLHNPANKREILITS